MCLSSRYLSSRYLSSRYLSSRYLPSRSLLKRSLYTFWMLCLVLVPLTTQAQGGLLDDLEEDNPCSVELISTVSAFQVGVPFEVGVFVKPIKDWHGYWHSPRDGGDSPEVSWNLPKGWKVSEPKFPVPVRMVETGNLIAYGYKNPFMIRYVLTPASSEEADSAEALLEIEKILITADVSWQVCKTTCIYGESFVKLSLQKSSAAVVDSRGQKLLAIWNSRYPKPVDQIRGFHFEQEWRAGQGPEGSAGAWTLRWARTKDDVRPAVPVNWRVFPHGLVAGILSEGKVRPWNPNLEVHKGLKLGKQVTFFVMDAGSDFHPGQLGATMVPSPGKAKGPVPGFPAVEWRGKP